MLPFLFANFIFQKISKDGSWGIPQSELGVDESGGVTFF